ncbi:hypothetical protein [Pleionea sp. CnH1-48]|uniref:hypothetical protein n=1 Tax=Pleionea sp. CnH1-48 TaxID=2954494 RepID=UPI0020984DC6|nr:hypothetical protein [Pleionea sp. CnH1-48]MCO7227316.1 hypothetical protein [Pleionea sp. CnH1-48]
MKFFLIQILKAAITASVVIGVLIGLKLFFNGELFRQYSFLQALKAEDVRIYAIAFVAIFVLPVLWYKNRLRKNYMEKELTKMIKERKSKEQE